MDSRTVAKHARKSLAGKMGRDIRLYEVKDISSINDYTLVATGMSPPQLKAMAGAVQRGLKDEGIRCYRQAGEPASGWIVLDYLDVVIHMFSPQTREFYAIEELWEKAPLLPED